MQAQDVLKFWFEEIDSKKWWVKDEVFDKEIQRRFQATHQKATLGELFRWRETAQGRLAEVIVLDQFSRNMFRNKPGSFAFDALALILSQEAVSVGADKQLESRQKSFLYMPYMHSESVEIHDEAIKLFSSDPELSFNLDFEKKHKVIIDRFGRYPHRNEILGRVSTSEEMEFLSQPGSSF